MKHWRDRIDEIDEQLVRLLNERSRCAVEIGRIKRQDAIELYQPDRETEILHRVTQVNTGPLDEAAVKRLFERIIDESRRVERIVLEKKGRAS